MDKKDKHGVGLQAKTVANAMIRHWLTIFDVPAVICIDRGSQFVGTWFKTMCKHMGIWHANTVAYHSWSNGRADVAGRQIFERFASCTLTNRAGIGTICCGEYSRRTTTFRGPLDCRPIVSCSCGIECHALSRG